MSMPSKPRRTVLNFSLLSRVNIFDMTKTTCSFSYTNTNTYILTIRAKRHWMVFVINFHLMLSTFLQNRECSCSSQQHTYFTMWFKHTLVLVTHSLFLFRPFFSVCLTSVYLCFCSHWHKLFRNIRICLFRKKNTRFCFLHTNFLWLLEMKRRTCKMKYYVYYIKQNKRLCQSNTKSIKNAHTTRWLYWGRRYLYNGNGVRENMSCEANFWFYCFERAHNRPKTEWSICTDKLRESFPSIPLETPSQWQTYSD